MLKYIFNKTFQQLDWAPLPFEKVCFRTKACSCAICVQFVQLRTTTQGGATHLDHEGNGIPVGSITRPYTHVPDLAQQGQETRYPKARKVNFGGEDKEINPERSWNIKA